MKKKNILLSLVFLLIPIVAVVIPKDSESLDNIAVNNSNGDVAYAQFDGKSSIALFVYDKNGNQLMNAEFDSKGGSHSIIKFDESNNICIYISRTDNAYVYSRDGSKLSAYNFAPSETNGHVKFDGWNTIGRTKCFVTQNRKYIYEKAPFPKYIYNNYCVLYIENCETNEVTTIYEHGLQ